MPSAGQSAPELLAKAESLAQVVVGGSTTDFVVDDTAAVTTNLSLNRVLSRQSAAVARNAVAQVVAVGVGQLGVFVGQDASRTIPSPLGGSVQVDVVGATVTAAFRDFRTPRATLNGTCRLTLVSGKLSSGSYQGTLNFTALGVATQSGTFTIEGTADLGRARAVSQTAFGLDSNWKANLKVSEAGGGSRTFQDFVTTSHVDIAAGVLSATQTYAGTLIVDNLQGVSGTFQISTPTPVRYGGTQQAFQVEAGQMLVSGTGGAVRLTVVGPNQIEIAVVSPGGVVTVVRTVSWTSLGGSASTD